MMTEREYIIYHFAEETIARLFATDAVNERNRFLAFLSLPFLNSAFLFPYIHTVLIRVFRFLPFYHFALSPSIINMKGFPYSFFFF